jgi:hypothetical protein
VDWNNDGNPDLLMGDSAGCVFIFLNIGTNADGTPKLDSGAAVEAGGADLCVGAGRAQSVYEDWDGDGYKDLLVGYLEGGINIYLNDDDNTFTYSDVVAATGWAPVPYAEQSRSAPRFFDWDGDGLKDLLVGEVYGYVWYFKNVTTDPEITPFVFDTAERLLLADGVTWVKFTLSSVAPRSRLYVTDWNEDGLNDIVLGGNDGRLQLFLMGPESVKGIGMNTPSAPKWRASMSVDITGTGPAGSVRYYYTRQRVSFESTGITSVKETAPNIIEITGTGNGKKITGTTTETCPNCSFLVTIHDDNPDRMHLKINGGDFYSAPGGVGLLDAGNFTVTR